MKIFVTGATGFIGGHFIELALARGDSVRAVRRPNSAPRKFLRQEPEWIEGDLETDFGRWLKGCDAFVHLAAAGVLASDSTWTQCFRWNVMALLGLLRSAEKAGVGSTVISGSCFEYGRSGERCEFITPATPLEPIGAYATSKAAASIAAVGLANERGLSLTILRPFHVYGEGEHPSRFWPSLRRAALDGDDFPMTPGGQIRDFCSVEDVASQFMTALHEPPPAAGYPEIRNIGSGKPQSLRDFAESWWLKWQARGKLKIGALPYRNHEIMRYVPLLTGSA